MTVVHNAAVRYRFEKYVLDEDARTLTGPDGSVHVEPQVFDVLSYLVTHRDRAVPKTELLDEIWGDQFVSESALTTRIKSARAALGDNGREQRHIRTAHGFGYQFVSEVVSLTTPDAPDLERDRLRGTDSFPRFHTPLRGRDDELREVAAFLDRHPLVTLLGPGGIGKTRLAVEVAGILTRRTDAEYLPSVFVDLAATRDPAVVPETIASALGIEVGQRHDPIEAVCEFLDAVPHVLVIDNCEQVLVAASHATATIIDHAECTHILATSREPLGLAGERLYRLGPLPLLGAGDVLTPDTVIRNPAVAMFLDRAQLAGSDPLRDATDARQVVELCRALEGLPLALELAAGRVSAFGVADLVGLLDHRLDILQDRSSAREHRHRTLRSTVEWSYDLLDDAEQRLFRSLAVFPAGVTIEAIDWLTNRLSLGETGLAAVGRLVDASLLVRHDSPSGSRYTQLETLRAFGLEKLEERGEGPEARELAASFTLVLLQQIETGLDTPDEARWVDRLRREFPNVQSARHHLAGEDRVDDLLEMSRRLTVWARVRDATDIWSWSDDLLRRVPEADPRRATVLAISAQASWRRGDIGGAIEAATTALRLEPDEWSRAQALCEHGAALIFSGDLVGAEAAWVELATLKEEAWGLGSAAVAVSYAGDHAAARVFADRATEAVRNAPRPSMVAWTEYVRAEVDNTIGIADLASLDRAIARAGSVDATFIVGVARLTHASAHGAHGNVSAAARSYAELIHHWLRSGSWTQQWTTLRHVAELIEDTDPQSALAILRAAKSDTLSPPALVDASSKRLRALTARLEHDVGDEVSGVPRRIEVVERALAALSNLS